MENNQNFQDPNFAYGQPGFQQPMVGQYFPQGEFP
jgi:hypothetical protein